MCIGMRYGGGSIFKIRKSFKLINCYVVFNTFQSRDRRHGLIINGTNNIGKYITCIILCFIRLKFLFYAMKCRYDI